MLNAAIRQKFKEDDFSSTSEILEQDESVAELDTQQSNEIAYYKRRRREVSEPPRFHK